MQPVRELLQKKKQIESEGMEKDIPLANGMKRKLEFDCLKVLGKNNRCSP